MFGRGSKKWDREIADHGLSPTEDPTPWINEKLHLLAAETVTTSSRPRPVNRAAEPLQFEWRRTTELIRAAVNTSSSGAGLVAAVQVKSREVTTSSNSVHHATTVGPKSQVIIGRLARPISGHVLVVPHYTPKILDGFEQNAERALGEGLAPPRLQHPLLQHWYSDVSGSPDDSSWIGGDDGLCALLWALRCKVAGAKDHIPELSRRYESLIPPVDRIYSSATVEVRGDVLACYRSGPIRGLDDKIVEQVRQVVSSFR